MSKDRLAEIKKRYLNNNDITPRYMHDDIQFLLQEIQAFKYDEFDECMKNWHLNKKEIIEKATCWDMLEGLPKCTIRWFNEKANMKMINTPQSFRKYWESKNDTANK